MFYFLFTIYCCALFCNTIKFDTGSAKKELAHWEPALFSYLRFCGKGLSLSAHALFGDEQDASGDNQDATDDVEDRGTNATSAGKDGALIVQYISRLAEISKRIIS